MKKITFTLLGLLSLLSFTRAQGDVTFFSEDGQRFYVVLNGKQYNQDPQTNVKVQDFANEYAKSIVIFENTALGQVSMDIRIAPGVETTYMVGLNPKGKYKIKYRGETALTARPVTQPAPVPQPNNVQPAYNPNEVPANNGNIATQPNNNGGGKNPMGVNMNIAVPDGEGGQVGFGMNVTGMGMEGDDPSLNMNMNINDGSSRTTTRTTTTTTTTITNGGGGKQPPVYQQPVYQQPVQQPVYQQPAPVQAPPAGRCVPTSASDFNTALNSINSKTFEDSKMTVAKQITASKCLSAAQIKQVAEAFTFESNKLAYAKYAYQYCFDQQNYYILNDVFTFESSIDELTKAIGQ